MNIDIAKTMSQGAFGQTDNVYLLTIDDMITIPTDSGMDDLEMYAFHTYQKISTEEDVSVRTSEFILNHVNGIYNIDDNEFFHSFTYFEAITTHYTALKKASNIEEYFNEQEAIRNNPSITLNKLLEDIAKSLTDTADKKQINQFRSTMLNVRNQIAHNLYPAFIKFNGVYCSANDPDLSEKVRAAMWNTMVILVREYRKEQTAKLEVWLQAFLNEVIS